MTPDRNSIARLFGRSPRASADWLLASRARSRSASAKRKQPSRHNRGILVCLCFLALGAGPADDADEPPVANQPLNFNGAIGNFREFTTQAAPTTLAVGDSLTFTVRITGSAQRPLPRPPLRRLPAFARHFVIEDLPGPEPKPGDGVWEFRYRLKPKPSIPPVKEIPALRFDYYKPGVIPREKGYRTKYAEAIPLTLQPRAEVQATDIQGTAPPVPLPAELYQLTEGPGAVLRRDEPFALPPPGILLLIGLGVPALCVGWYVWWRQAYPDAARLVGRRQSQAARRAIQELEAVSRQTAAMQGQPVAAILTGYLHHRWDLTAVEPTPQEVAAHLERHGCPEPSARQAALFYEHCDVARFAPDLGAAADDLPAAAVRLIQTLEDQP